jgi:hypothetical protein
MNTDELDGLRILISVAPGSIDLEETAKILLEHIDAQAACKQVAERHLDECHERMRIANRRIATLKTALIEHIAQDKIAQMGRFGFVLDPEVCNPYGDAKKQLARELPGIGWDG